MSRVTREDWITFGLEQLPQKGASWITLENLCSGMNKTRGSFYHHFQDMDSYLGALFELWEQRNTLAPIEIADQGQNRVDKLRRLDLAVSELDHRLEQIIRRWAEDDPRATSALKRVDGIRLDYLNKAFQELGLSAQDSYMMAQLEYALLLGCQQLFSDLKSAEVAKMKSFFEKHMGRSFKTKD